MRRMTQKALAGRHWWMDDFLVELPVALVTKRRDLGPQKVRIVAGMRIMAEGAHPCCYRRVNRLLLELAAVVTVETEFRG